MKWYKADLHIHSVLSPCGSLEMSPDVVIKKAKEQQLDIIAITDHNSMANSEVYIKKAKKAGLTCFWGLEAQSSEEIHVIALFDDGTKALDFANLLYNSLLPIDNDPDYFGDQVIIDENDEIVKFEEKALINSSMFSYEELVNNIQNAGGFAFPAHVDAHTYSVIAQLGFVPDYPKVTALGLTAKCKIQDFVAKNEYIKKYALIKNSDAHYPNDIGKAYTEFFLKEPTVAEIALACQNIDERSIRR